MTFIISLRRSFALIISLVGCLSAMGQSQTHAQSSQWPLIKSLSWSGDIDLLGPPTIIPIVGADGRVVYRFYCSSRFGKPAPYSLSQGDAFSGDFECWLTDSQPDVVAERPTLLNVQEDDLSPYHNNLGRFIWDELLGRNWNNPEWGSDRKIYLRAMCLRLHVLKENVELHHDGRSAETYPIIRSVRVEILAVPDKRATTRLAARPVSAEPDEPRN